ncbi:hypothetical protein ACFVMC_11230 [Nocardia sp. NPDC127579]|uniref:hypothetical protein n=1 Tax=Nocardia sp. NPDC127579 TaxID=3345402 RepID=UPI0036323E93
MSYELAARLVPDLPAIEVTEQRYPELALLGSRALTSPDPANCGKSGISPVGDTCAVNGRDSADPHLCHE